MYNVSKYVYYIYAPNQYLYFQISMEDFTIQNYSLDSLNDTLEEDDFDGTVSDFQYYVEGVGIIVTASVGLIINIFALYILMKKHVSTS